jgi:hypothetical protein
MDLIHHMYVFDSSDSRAWFFLCRGLIHQAHLLNFTNNLVALIHMFSGFISHFISHLTLFSLIDILLPRKQREQWE